MPTSTVVITGGNSRTTRQLVDTFLNHPDCPNLRVLVNPQGVDALKEAFPLLTSSPHSVFATNYMDGDALVPALRSATIVVHNGPSVHQNEVVSCNSPSIFWPQSTIEFWHFKILQAIAISLIEAAKKAGIRFFIFCSVLHPMRSKLVTHTAKLKWVRCLNFEFRICLECLGLKNIL